MTVEQAPLFPSAELSPRWDLATATREFAHFRYQLRPYAARNWGHPLHSLCSYPSKIKPGLAHFLVKCFTGAEDRVLDPFSGVGTIPFEAALQGRCAIGMDLSPFAALVTMAKLNPPAAEELDDALSQFETDLRVAASHTDIADVEVEIRSFFEDQTCREVVASQRLLFDTPIGMTRAGRFIAAATCHILHGNRPYALSRRSHGIIPIPPQGDFVYKPLMASLREKLARLRLHEIPADFLPGEAALRNAFVPQLAEKSVDALITSPPFLGTTEFLRQNRVRLWYCGMSYDQQLADKDQFVEHIRDLSFYGPLLAEWAHVLRPGGRLVMHLGVVRKRDMAREIEQYAERAGFAVHEILYEPASHLESHGRTDRGATHTHQFLIAERGSTSVE